MSLVAALSLFLFPNFAHAQVIFTEIMFDVPGTDSGREWIEVTNISDNSVSIEEYKLFEANANHSLTLISGDGNLSLNESAVIASDPDKFKIDWPAFSGTLLDSSFSLSNTGETLILRDKDLVDQDTVSYTADSGALGDGNTLSLSAGSFTSLAPSPGIYGSGEVLGTSTENTSGGTTNNLGNLDISAHASAQEASFVNEVIDIKLAAQRDRVSLVGMPIVLEAQALSAKSSTKYVDGVTYEWSLGDGFAQTGQKISYAYLESGEYVVIVRAKFKESEAVSRSKVNVLPFEIKISNVDREEFVELKNNLASEVNIGGAIIDNGEVAFRMPTDTIMLPNKKLRIPKEVLNLDLSREKIYLKDALGKEIFVFENKIGTGEVLGESVISDTTAPPTIVYEVVYEAPEKPKIETKPEPKPTLKSAPKIEGSSEKLEAEQERNYQHKAFQPIQVISKKKEGVFARTLRFFGNLF